MKSLAKSLPFGLGICTALLLTGCLNEQFFSRLNLNGADDVPIDITIGNGDPNQPGVQPSVLPSPSPSASPTPSPSPSAAALTDGIWVNVAYVEVITFSDYSKRDVQQVAQNLGLVNFADLQLDAFKKLGNIMLKPRSVLHEIRVVTYLNGHYWIQGGQKICDIVVPSGASSGVKLKNADILIESNRQYSLSILVNASDLVIRGNGLCNLHPVYDGEILVQ